MNETVRPFVVGLLVAVAASALGLRISHWQFWGFCVPMDILFLAAWRPR